MNAANVVMSLSDRENAIELFCSYLKDDIEVIKFALAKSASNFIKQNIINVSMVLREQTRLGLHAILNNDENLVLLPTKDSAYFLLHYFNLTFLTANDDLKKLLRGRIIGGLKTDMGFPALLFELATAHTFKLKGNSVSFIEETSTETPDLIVSSKYNDLIVECKCIYALSKYHTPEHVLQPASQIATDYLKAIGGNKSENLLTIHYVGKRDSKADEVIDDLLAALKKINGQICAVTAKFWRVNLSKLPEELQGLEIYRSFAKSSLLNHPLIKDSALCCVSGHGLVAMRSTGLWDQREAVERVVKKALTQLPKQGMRIICLQIIGSSGYLHLYKKGLIGMLESALAGGDTKRRFSEEEKKQNGFVGISICSDFEFQLSADNSIRINYDLALKGSRHREDVNMYLYDIMNYMPSQFSF
jgi:hypothetical protein